MGRQLTVKLMVAASLALVLGCAMSQEATLTAKSKSESDLFRKSQSLYVQGDHQGALETINLAIKREPGRAELWNGRGYIQMNEKNFSEAVGDFSKSLELDPDCVQCQHNLGVGYLESGRLSDGLEALTIVIKKAPESDMAFNHRGLVYSRLGQYDNAIADFTSAIDLNPSNGHYYLNRAVSYVKSGSGQMAKEDLDRAVDLNDSLKEAYESRGLIELDEGEFYSAIRDFSKAIVLGQTHGLVFYNRAVALSMTGDLSGARKDYQQACRRGIPQACGEVVRSTSWEREFM